MNAVICQKTFDELTNQELYEILELRSLVFVVEQNAIYQDLDGKDQASTHFFIKENNKVVAYIRTLPKGIKFEDSASLGRVVTNKDVRHSGYARSLINKGIEHLLNTESSIVIEGQAYLRAYYESFGFRVISDLYLVDGIDHYKMILNR
ncbi:ElaA protein [Acholeplasma morum]|uniref:GNAT family N-acetyltransferase n=1 Tax=Paracholeplasma morum TaxID=264637 RepID=UPI001959E1AA|nr:GNAT family N-acetyltransferase [Paracholeplasma morum]MBM7453214.1 ElaA protein [Paracholeplasma morum]